MSAPTSPDLFGSTFAEDYSSGDSDALMDFYAPGAVMQGPGGQLLTGREAIRNALVTTLANGHRMQSRLRFMIRADEIALLRNDFSLHGRHGKEIFAVKSCEVITLCEDGRWRLLIDHPFGASL